MIMRIDILTLFPEMFTPLETSIMGRAKKDGKIEINIVNIRDYTQDKHLKCDDYPFGGGAGMVMMAPPIGNAIEAIDPDHKARRIYMSPKGQVFSQAKAVELSRKGSLLILCGHYEGIDERVLESLTDEQISIGDYVLTNGALPAAVVIDSVTRLLPGVLGGGAEATAKESFSKEGLLEQAQYTRPPVHRGKGVPEVLLKGDHAQMERWRKNQMLDRTSRQRPDLIHIKENDNDRESPRKSKRPHRGKES